jgi:hypothetical protein
MLMGLLSRTLETRQQTGGGLNWSYRFLHDGLLNSAQKGTKHPIMYFIY